MMGGGQRDTLYLDDRLAGVARWVIGNPTNLLMRVPDDFLRFSVFVAVDEGGESFALAGTAFILGMDGPPPHLYLVTARHCVEKAQPYGGLSVRFNNHVGGSDLVRVDSPWYFPDHEADDVAVMSLPRGLSKSFDFLALPISTFAATEEIVETEGIGIGDEILVTGLFTRRGGQDQNRPIVRTGVIAAMPTEPLKDLNSGLNYDAYLIELRSIGGLSGSPVYVMFPPARMGKTGFVETSSVYRIVLLGLIRGHWDARAEEFADFGEESELEQLNTGIAVVTPIQKAVEVIATTEELVKERRRREREYAEAQAPTQDSADSPDAGNEEFGQFESLARRLVNIPKAEIDEKRRAEES